jgi:hypothetical protein
MERRTKGGDFQAKKHAECQDRGDGGEIRRDRVVLVIASEELKSSKRQTSTFGRGHVFSASRPGVPLSSIVVSFRAAPIH